MRRRSSARLAQRSAGFTVIELAVVVVILSILLTLVALTYSGVQAKTRNNRRQDAVNSLQAQLEKYYAASPNGEYPTLAQLNDPSWRAKNAPKITDDLVRDPRWNAKAGCSAGGQPALSAAPRANCYAYQVTDASGGACNDTTAPCAHYTLTAEFEGGRLTYVKSSLN